MYGRRCTHGSAVDRGEVRIIRALVMYNNTLEIKCDCGIVFPHHSDRWRVECPFCKRIANLNSLRDAFAEDKPCPNCQHEMEIQYVCENCGHRESAEGPEP